MKSNQSKIIWIKSNSIKLNDADDGDDENDDDHVDIDDRNDDIIKKTPHHAGGQTNVIM